MNSSNRPLLILLTILAIAASAAASLRRPKDALVGGYSQIKNLNDPHVIEVAKYAVTEHNEKTGSNLEYQSVEKGESQVVAGFNYKLLIKAKDGEDVEKYEAVVYERPWEKFRSLTSFKKL